MSNAPRPATWKIRSRSCAGHDRWLGQRMSASPSFSWRSSVPHSGQCVGITNSRSVPVAQVDDRTDDLRDHVTGLAQHDGVPDEHALAPHLRGVVQRGHLHGRPGHEHRLHHAVRRHAAGPADVDADVEELGVDLLGRVLERDRPPRCPRGGAEAALQRHLVDLHHHAVDLVLDLVAVLAVVLDVLLDAGQGRTTRTRSETGSPQAARAAYASDWRVGGEPLAGPMPVADHRQRPRRRDPRVLLPQGPGRRVARVRERRLACGDQRLVERGERLAPAGTPPRGPRARAGHRELGRVGEPVRDRAGSCGRSA